MTACGKAPISSGYGETNVIVGFAPTTYTDIVPGSGCCPVMSWEEEDIEFDRWEWRDVFASGD